jgi:hypothetical protein
MSADPQYDGVITLEPRLGVAEPAPLAALAVVELPTPPPFVPVPAPAPAAPRRRPGWLVPAAIAAVGLIASGMLGYLFYSTNLKLEVTRQTLASTKVQLTNLQADAAAKKQVAEYVSMYTVDSGKVQTDYQQLNACNSFSTCRTSAQQTLDDMQRFQSDRQSAQVPAGLSASDSQLGDSLSAGIAAVQQLISGMDTDDAKKVDAAFTNLNDAMLGIAKAESALGAELR